MDKQAYVITDISYGDAGKGTTVDYLVRQTPSAAVVRHNGGPQAAHNVITPDGRHHTFAQFGSGSLVPGVATHLSRFMLVSPLNMLHEAEHLIAIGAADIWQRTTVDEGVPLVLPWHRAANKLRELSRGNSRHGSCGQGVGEVKADLKRGVETTLRAGDLRTSTGLKTRLEALRAAKYRQLLDEIQVPGSPAAALEWSVFHDPDLVPWLCDRLDQWMAFARLVPGGYLAQLAECYDTLVFEGAQGVLLDEAYGFHPYTTWSDTTPRGALTLLSEIGYAEPVAKLGVLRAYTTRHGAGPFVTEDPSLAGPLAEYHNGTGDWQGAFRYGHLDLVAHQYALDACGGLDALVVTGLDRLAALPTWRYCTAYDYSGPLPADAPGYFRFAGNGLMQSLVPGERYDRPHQARLTELVSACSPVYQMVNKSGTPDIQEPTRELLDIIEKILGTRVVITSQGPTSADKTALVPA